MKISMKLVYQYMEVSLNFSLTSNHLHPLQVENCDSDSRLVVDEDDNGIIRDERVNSTRPPLSRSPSHIDREKESRTRDVYMAGVAVRRSTDAPRPHAT